MNQIENLQNLKIKPLPQSLSQPKMQSKQNATILHNTDQFIKGSLSSTKQYYSTEKKILSETIQTLIQQKETLENQIQRNRKLKQDIDIQLQQVQGETQKIKQYVPPYDERILLGQIKEYKGMIINLNKMRLQEANAININDLKTLSIKNKDKESPINEIWIWVIVLIYKEPASSYYWNNFKNQVIKNDEGAKDFKERMGKVKAVDMKQDEIERTQKLLKMKNQILLEPLVTPILKVQLELIFKIVSLMLDIEEFGNKIRQNEKLLQQMEQQQFQFEKDLLRNSDKLKTLTEGLNFLETIYTQYSFMYNMIERKIEEYRIAPSLSDKILLKVQTGFNNLNSQGKSENQPKEKAIMEQPLLYYQRVDSSFPEVGSELEPEKAQAVSSKPYIQLPEGACQIY